MYKLNRNWQQENLSGRASTGGKKPPSKSSVSDVSLSSDSDSEGDVSSWKKKDAEKKIAIEMKLKEAKER